MRTRILLTTVFFMGSSASAASFSENFDEPGGFFGGGYHSTQSFPPADWQVINLSSPLGSSSWYDGPQSGHEAFSAQSGSTFAEVDAASGSGTAELSNWLLTPTMSFNAGDKVSFYTRTATTPIAADRLQLRFSTAGTSTNVGSSPSDVGDFSNLLVDINPNYKTSGGGSFPNSWTQFTMTMPTSGSGRLAFRYFVEDGGPLGTNSDFIGLDTITVTPTNTGSQWALSGGGSWGSAGSWSGGIPNAAATQVSFGSAINADAAVTLDGNKIIGQITFDSAHSYSINPGMGGTLSLDNTGGTGSASITVNSGAHTIAAPLAVSGATTISTASSSALNISGNITGSGGLTKTGSGSLTLGGTDNYGDTTVSGGMVTLSSSASLASNNVTVASSGALNVIGSLSNTAALAVNGTVTFGPNLGTGILVRTVASVNIGASGLLKLFPLATIQTKTIVLITNSLTLAGTTDAWTGKMDLGGNALIVHNGNLSQIANQIKQAYAGGTWNGTGGIGSSSAIGSTSPKTALGYASTTGTFDGQAVSATDVVVKYTLVGDASLDGSVNFTDLLTVAQHYNGTNTSWSSGDFNYDGTTNFTDLLGLAQNYNKSSTLSALEISTLDSAGTSSFVSAFAQAEAQVSVPEPSFAVLFLTPGILRHRRRNAVQAISE